MARTQLQRRSLGSPFMSTLARDMDQLQENIRRTFENPFSMTTEPFFSQTIGWLPAVDVTESDNELKMTVELPGLDSKDVKIEIEGNMLTLSGEKRAERVEEGKDKQYYLEERTFGAFQRSFTLPPSIADDKINATFDKGLLTLHLPKGKVNTNRGREIPINANK